MKCFLYYELRGDLLIISRWFCNNCPAVRKGGRKEIYLGIKCHPAISDDNRQILVMIFARIAQDLACMVTPRH